jgi:hypothetical protein
LNAQEQINKPLNAGMGSFVKIALLTAALAGSGLAAGQAPTLWIAFRYSPTQVLLYAANAKDTAGFTASEASIKQVPQPIARWGGGGYLMPLTRARLSALQIQSPGEEVLHGLAPGVVLTVRFGSQQTVSATIERFVEQWGSANPEVQLGVIARIRPEDVPKFQSNRNDYFLTYKGGPPAIAGTLQRQEIAGTRYVLNSFGEIGQIIVEQGDAGWNVALWRHFHGKFMPTDIAYCYGD